MICWTLSLSGHSQFLHRGTFPQSKSNYIQAYHGIYNFQPAIDKNVGFVGRFALDLCSSYYLYKVTKKWETIQCCALADPLSIWLRSLDLRFVHPPLLLSRHRQTATSCLSDPTRSFQARPKQILRALLPPPILLQPAIVRHAIRKSTGNGGSRRMRIHSARLFI